MRRSLRSRRGDVYRTGVLRGALLAGSRPCSRRRGLNRFDPVGGRGIAACRASSRPGRLPRLRGGGGDDPRVNWVEPFVQKTGCKVHVRTVRSSTELLEVVGQGSYDGVAAFGDVTQVLTGGKEVQPIDTDLIPAYDDVYPALKTLPQNLEHGRIVGIPHGRGADLLLWRTDLVHPAPKSWDVLYDPRYAGRIGLRDEAITLAQTAIHLGYRNPYELGKAQFLKVVRAAAEQGASVGAYWQDVVTALADFTGGTRSSARPARGWRRYCGPTRCPSPPPCLPAEPPTRPPG